MQEDNQSTTEELLISLAYQFEALVRVLENKHVITQEELLLQMQRLQQEMMEQTRAKLE